MYVQLGTLKRSDGRSLVEVMISLTIGLMIVLALTSLFAVNRQTYRATDDKSRLDDEGRLALNLIAHHVRMAGYGNLLLTIESGVREKSADNLTSVNETYPTLYTDFSNSEGKSVNAIQGCAGGFLDPSSTVSPIPCAAGVGADAFRVSYVVDRDSANTTAGFVPTDCLGAALVIRSTPAEGKKPAGGDKYVVDNRFFVRMNNGVPELYCQGNGNTPEGAPNLVNPPQPVAENVEQMRVVYGIANNDGQTIDRYIPANSVTDWNSVVSLKICLVMRSTNDKVAMEKQTYRDCNDTLVTAVDNRLRGVFSTTISIRSRSTGAT
ncbi:PilW family protein [Undibacterium danionis]|uniref:PilW family protein n=1 Tax=Undibacterium danionis TaxID=1812100 RepID=A0ABV6IJ86_9BURK